ncbi:hypothetical protein WG906_18710 [Pedobacter sp. P351]|uniref:hypothetical protein n=1 Tax=Pedobacter superstes TaxID=3133441 RepID=UPI0030A03EC7
MRLSIKYNLFPWVLLIGFSSSIVSCDRNYSCQHSGEEQRIPLVGDLSTEQEIEEYADSINLLLSSCEEKTSMVYTLNTYTFQVRKFVHNGETVLYSERGDNGEYGSIHRLYFIKDDMPVLLKEKSVNKNNLKPFRYTHVYFHGGKAFHSEYKTGSTALTIQKVPFESSSAYIDHSLALETYEDALNQRRKFDLVFEGITECPKAKYLILSRKEINSYRAPVKVEKEDEFIRELCSNPMRYRGEKLEINWSTNGSEIVYAKGRLKNRD